MLIEMKKFIVMRDKRTEILCDYGLGNTYFEAYNTMNARNIKFFNDHARAWRWCLMNDKNAEVVPVIESLREWKE